MYIEKSNLTIPNPVNRKLIPLKGQNKVKTPDTQTENLWNDGDVKLLHDGSNYIFLQYNKSLSNLTPEFGFEDFIAHPFVYTELNIPGLIHFSRSTPFKTERFLHTRPDPIVYNPNNIITIIKSDVHSGNKIYTHQLMSAVFNTLKQFLAKQNNEITETLKLQIGTICDAFLADINESAVNKTVSEGETVSYIMGKSAYVVNSLLNWENSLGDQLMIRKQITPVLSYNLISCDVPVAYETEEKHVLSLKYFHFIDEVQKKKTITDIKQCLTFKCTLCKLNFSLAELQLHIISKHYVDQKFKCAVCSKTISLRKLLADKWEHDCFIRTLYNRSIPAN